MDKKATIQFMAEDEADITLPSGKIIGYDPETEGLYMYTQTEIIFLPWHRIKRIVSEA